VGLDTSGTRCRSRSWSGNWALGGPVGAVGGGVVGGILGTIGSILDSGESKKEKEARIKSLQEQYQSNIPRN
jgi:outer membrane lipoprotein SlyB